MEGFHHVSVMKEEVIAHLLPSATLWQMPTPQTWVFVDVTLGGGGHSAALVQALAPFLRQAPHISVKLMGCDRDSHALQAGTKKVRQAIQDTQVNIDFSVVESPFGQWFAAAEGLQCQGVMADFGLSSYQLDTPQRGFSFLHEGPLDMRMGSHGSSAHEILSDYSEQELAQIFFDYGEEPKARILAKAIVQDRQKGALPLSSTTAFAEYVKRVLRYPYGRTHPATRTFQALRIAVNEELEEIQKFLGIMPERMCRNEGKLVCLSFHSLEDRLVKRAFRSWQRPEPTLPDPLHLRDNPPGMGRELPRGGLVPSAEECAANPRARSARMRCFVWGVS